MDQDQHVIKNMAIQCALALGLVGILACGSYFILTSYIKKESSYGDLVTTSGFEGTLSQRLTLISLSLVSTKDPKLQEQFRAQATELANLLEKSHQALLHGDIEKNIPSMMSDGVAAIYFQAPMKLDERIQRFLSEVRALVITPSEKLSFDNPHLEYVTASSTDLLRDLGVLADQYRLDGRDWILRLQQIGLIMLGLTMLLLLGISILIFRPMVSRLGAELKNRTETARQLNDLTEKLSIYSHNLERSNKDLEYFARVIVHDLMAPLRNVSGFIELLDKKFSGAVDEKAREYMNIIQGGVKRMNEMIAALFEFSKVASKSPAVEVVNLNEVVKEILSDLTTVIKDSSAKVSVEDLPTIRGDRVQLRQLFQNLLQNGMKFRSQDKAPIIAVTSKLVTENNKQMWKVSVTDNGIGFDPLLANRIFEIFQRLHNDEKYEGTGIGLAICKRIAERHGGSISAQSERGKGATFSVMFPK